MKSLRRLFCLMAGLSAFLLIFGSPATVFASPAVTLTVLNAPDEFGDVIVVRGDSVEVELTVVDPLNESSSSDLIRLVRINDGTVANQQKRGKDLSGSRSLGTQKTNGSDVLGELQVQYISAVTKQVIAVSDKNIFLVDNQAVVELTTRTSAVEKEAAAAKAQAEAAEAKADAADAKATDAQSRADILQARADQLKARADAADNERYAAKLEREAARLEREAAKLERLANAAAAQDAKAAAAAADTKAADAKTKADAADTKATAADAKAAAADARAAAADAKAAAADTKATAADTKATAADTKATAADTKATAADAKAAAADAKATAADAKAAAADARAAAAAAKAADAEAAALLAEQQAASAETKADLALTENVNLQTQITQINNISAQSCPSGEYVTGMDANGNFICAPVAAAAPALSLLAYYPLDGDVLDASGNAYDGTVGGTEAYDTGYIGQAFSFNRATYIATSLDIDVSVEPQLTMGAWVLPVGSFYGQVLTHDDQGFDRSLIYYNGDWRAYDGYGGGSVHTGLQPATGAWQFVAAVYDQDKQTVTMFVDGTAVTKAGQLLGPSVNMFRIANNESNGVEFFSGLIDEVFVVSGALSVAELEQIRLNGVRSMFP